MPVRVPDKSAKLTPPQLRRKIALLKKGLSIADVARDAGVSRQTAWEVFRDRCTSEKVEKSFAKLTGVAREKLFPRKSQPASAQVA